MSGKLGEASIIDGASRGASKGSDEASQGTSQGAEKASQATSTPQRHVVRRWVVVVDVADIQAPQRILLCMLPFAKKNFGAIVFDTLCKARRNSNVPGTYFYEDVDASVLPIKSVTTRAKTQAVLAGCYPGLVLYFYAATKLPPAEEISKAVQAWKQANNHKLEAALKSIADSTLAAACDPKTTSVVLATPGLTITVVPVPGQTSPVNHGASSKPGKNNTNNTTNNNNNNKPSVENEQGYTQPAKRKLDGSNYGAAGIVDRLVMAISDKIAKVQKVEEAKQNLETAQSQYAEAQRLVEDLRRAIIGS